MHQLNPLDWQWIFIGLAFVVGGTAALTWLLAWAVMGRWRDRAEAAERTVARLRRDLRRSSRSAQGDATVVLAPAVLDEADRLLAGEAATQVLRLGSTRRMRRLHSRVAATAGRRRVR